MIFRQTLNQRYRKHMVLPPIWQKYTGTIVDMNGGYGIEVNLEGHKLHYTQQLENIDHKLAFLYARIDNQIEILINKNNMSEYTVLLDDYFKRQEQKKSPKFLLPIWRINM